MATIQTIRWRSSPRARASATDECQRRYCGQRVGRGGREAVDAAGGAAGIRQQRRSVRVDRSEYERDRGAKIGEDALARGVGVAAYQAEGEQQKRRPGTAAERVADPLRNLTPGVANCSMIDRQL